jgi:predicted small metal-binding protein
MERYEMIVECPCGTLMQEFDEDDLVEQVQHHASSVHDMTLEREQVLAMARHA